MGFIDCSKIPVEIELKKKTNTIIRLVSNLFRFIHSTNRANLGYTLAVNHLADKTDAELKVLRGKQYTKFDGPNGGLEFPYDVKEEIKNIPDSIDWRLYGAVTPVKGMFETSKIHTIFVCLEKNLV